MAELWLLLGKEDLASWARRVPAGAGPARRPGLRRRGTVAGPAAPACVPGTASPEGQGGAPMSSTWGASELRPQLDRAGGRPPHSLPWLKAFPKKESE